MWDLLAILEDLKRNPKTLCTTHTKDLLSECCSRTLMRTYTTTKEFYSFFGMYQVVQCENVYVSVSS